MVKKDSVKKHILKMAAGAVKATSKVYMEEWPPHCTSILHQPKRPKKK